MNVVEREFDIRGRRIAARVWHDASLPPVLALHGWQDNAASFDRVAPLLPQHHIVAMDFAGHGRSDWRPPGCRYHTVDHVDDVLAVADALGWEKFSLLGHSMGAGIAVLLAGALPERIERLVLIDGLGPWPGAAEEAPAILAEALLEWRDWRPREERVFATIDEAVAARRRGFTPLSEAAARLLCTRGLRSVPGGYVWTLDRRVRQHSSLRFTEAQVLAFLARIAAPTLLLRALPGFPGVEDMFAARLQALRQVELQQLAGSHHLHLEDSVADVAALLRGFLAASASVVAGE